MTEERAIIVGDKLSYGHTFRLRFISVFFLAMTGRERKRGDIFEFQRRYSSIWVKNIIFEFKIMIYE